MLVGGKSTTPTQELMNGIRCAGWWRVRGKGKEESCTFGERKMRAFMINEASPLYLGGLNMVPFDLFPSDIFGPSKCQGTLSCESTILLRACHFHPCMRVSRWDADSEY
jgi:hypothetical protein